jgi:hypothetical protein
VPIPNNIPLIAKAVITRDHSRVKTNPSSEIAIPGKVILFGNLRSRKSITMSGIVVAAKKPMPIKGNIPTS